MKRLVLAVGVVAWGFQTGVVSAGERAAGGDQEAVVARFLRERPQARLHRVGSRITRVYGTAIETGDSPEAAAERFRAGWAQVFGVEADDLLPVSSIIETGNTLPILYERRTGQYKFSLIYYSQYKDGVPVFRSDLRLLVRNEPPIAVVLAASSLKNLGDFTVDRALVAAPLDLAKRVAPKMRRFSAVETVIWAGVDDSVVQPSVAYTFIADNDGAPDTEKPEKWLYVVDAASGKILYLEDQIVFEDVIGNVSGLATQGLGAEHCEAEVATALPWARVNIGTTVAYADAAGDFVVPNAGTSDVTVESRLWGRWFRVYNQAGSDSVLSQIVTPPGPADFLHNATNTEYVRAEVNGYLQANVVRDFVLVYNPSYPGLQQSDFPVNVNDNSFMVCPGNAWYDGSSINFCRAGGGSPNTAWGSVIHHEYGHHLVQMAGSGQGEYGEGMGDVIGLLISDDPGVGYGFFGDCNTPLRTADNNCQYQTTGCSTCGSEVHDCGRLLSGCVWSTRNELAVTNPTNYIDILANLAINAMFLHSGTAIDPSITVDYLTLDDDDGNINNGTPHWNEICAGFGAHNMDCPALATGMSVSPSTDLVSSGPSGGPFTPSSKVYTVENLGPGTINYSVTHGQTWVTITNASGTLNVGQTANVTVSINANANSLPDGNYNDVVSFINTTDGVGNTTRSVTLAVGVPDNCASATSVCPGTYSDTTVGMSNDGSASCGSSDTTPDVWFKYTPVSSGTLSLELCNSDYDTVLSVHTGCPPTAGNEIGCNDDTDWFGACSWLPTLQSALDVSVTAGNTYYIRISGYNGATGTYVLDVSGPACAPVPTGACCFAGGSCSAGMEEAACLGAGGSYQGDGTTCSPNPCPQPCTLLGDIDGNGLVNGDDIAGYVRVKLGTPDPGDNAACADYNTGTLDGDTAAFVADLLGIY